MEIFVFLLGVTVLPIVINKSTERGRFDFIYPYLREIWMVLLSIFTWYVFEKPSVTEFVMRNRDGWIAYLLVFILGGVLLSLYWWATGFALSETEPIQPGPAVVTIGKIKPKHKGKLLSGPEPFAATFQIKASGGTASNVLFAYYLWVLDDASPDTQLKAANSFERDWPTLRLLSKPLSAKLSSRKPLSFTILGSPISDSEREDIISGNRFVVFVGDLRYEDSEGAHEIQFCRYLAPPFDGSAWVSGVVHEGTRNFREAKIPVQVSYDPVVSNFPLISPPNSRFYVFAVDDNKAAGIIWRPPSTVPDLWPHRFPPKSEHMIGAITFSNHDDKSVILNLTTNLGCVIAPSTSDLDVKDKPRALVSTWPDLVYRYVPFSVESLAPGQSVRIFVVNQSRFAVLVILPKLGMLELPGETEKREVDFKLRYNSPFDSDVAIIQPSPYLWKNEDIVSLRQQ